MMALPLEAFRTWACQTAQGCSTCHEPVRRKNSIIIQSSFFIPWIFNNHSHVTTYKHKTLYYDRIKTFPIIYLSIELPTYIYNTFKETTCLEVVTTEA